ncbi:MAG: two-component system response regulator UvrY [Oceanospirillaceae bacterium]|uniref:UvrY/SirA/GacA family response regulator transcription factor n=3 Tax=unclassified Thalassolituus TaxID=2624967 RepID=UPI000C61DD06|nr:UvrY/SirA/GacA family response regulator transcription factor [Thalassolituus sp. UBA6592]MAS25475.1 two-component system response regulator UvrY [Oceanospirillaceae bacterium]MAX98899.1 two-component system response regulator UvrY [Oceanospirillaceae bacterium]MBS51992.1 two-component system response regulator UvrY [Oceanospirillaceae bacterium]
MIKVLVVDDHELVRSGISRLLSDAKGIEVVGEAESGEEAVQFAKEYEPDIVLMDIRMPGIGGLEATRKIIRQNEEIQVIAVTACDDNPYASRLLQAGASGYITKGADAEEMVNAILKVKSGQKYISPEIAQRMALKPFQQDQASPFDELSEREMQIALMIVGCQKVSEISEKLFLSPKTVNSYRYRIFEKLNIDSDVQLTHLAVRYGLVDPAAAS